MYVDNDPVVRNHAEAPPAEDESTIVLGEDIREPERILAHPDVQRMLDFSQPIAVMFVAVLPFVTDEQDPWGIVSTLTQSVVPGSYLTRTHVTLDDRPADLVTDIQEKYKNTFRAAVNRFFDGFDLVAPGLVRITEWRSDELERARPGGEWLLAGMGRKP